MTFKTKLSVSEHPEDEHLFVLNENLEYKGKEDTWIVPSGFVTDFASVPKALWNVFPPYGKYTKAAVVHDYLCRYRLISRKDADGVFRRIMKELGVKWRRKPMYWAVRAYAMVKGIK